MGKQVKLIAALPSNMIGDNRLLLVAQLPKHKGASKAYGVFRIDQDGIAELMMTDPSMQRAVEYAGNA